MSKTPQLRRSSLSRHRGSATPLWEGGAIKDMSKHSILSTRQRILAACIAAACAVAVPDAVAVPRATGTAAAPSPDVPNLTVTNCNDSGAGSLRDALANPPDGTI